MPSARPGRGRRALSCPPLACAAGASGRARGRENSARRRRPRRPLPHPAAAPLPDGHATRRGDFHGRGAVMARAVIRAGRCAPNTTTWPTRLSPPPPCPARLRAPRRRFKFARARPGAGRVPGPTRTGAGGPVRRGVPQSAERFGRARRESARASPRAGFAPPQLSSMRSSSLAHASLEWAPSLLSPTPARPPPSWPTRSLPLPLPPRPLSRSPNSLLLPELQ